MYMYNGLDRENKRLLLTVFSIEQQQEEDAFALYFCILLFRGRRSSRDDEQEPGKSTSRINFNRKGIQWSILFEMKNMFPLDFCFMITCTPLLFFYSFSMKKLQHYSLTWLAPTLPLSSLALGVRTLKAEWTNFYVCQRDCHTCIPWFYTKTCWLIDFTTKREACLLSFLVCLFLIFISFCTVSFKGR